MKEGKKKRKLYCVHRREKLPLGCFDSRMRHKSPDLGFILFADHLPDSFLKPLELISYLNVICAQSWEPKEAFGNLRGNKISL